MSIGKEEWQSFLDRYNEVERAKAQRDGEMMSELKSIGKRVEVNEKKLDDHIVAQSAHGAGAASRAKSDIVTWASLGLSAIAAALAWRKNG